MPTTDGPKGFLFVCPAKDFQSGPTSCRWPECPVYWSLDPSGIEKLSTDETRRLGFPFVQLTDVYGSSWDASVYINFTEAKVLIPTPRNLLGISILHLHTSTTRKAQIQTLSITIAIFVKKALFLGHSNSDERPAGVGFIPQFIPKEVLAGGSKLRLNEEVFNEIQALTGQVKISRKYLNQTPGT
ncbi:hypothetical protein B0H19DRAFT_1068380 [Mycena capillaripes]|nr:hypothetical protein B0H19DRAFT_1068380 [Mycena capillaripes]